MKRLLFLTLLMAASFSTGAVPTDDIQTISIWLMDVNDGGYVRDSSILSTIIRDLKLDEDRTSDGFTNQADVTTGGLGVDGEALYFPGLAVARANPFWSSEWDQVTIDFWMKPETLLSPGPEDNIMVTSGVFRVYIQDPNRLRFEVLDSSNNRLNGSAPCEVSIHGYENKWLHVVCDFNVVDQNIVMSVEDINDSPVGSDEEAVGAALNARDIDMQVGGWIGEDPNRSFNGWLDNVKFSCSTLPLTPVMLTTADGSGADTTLSNDSQHAPTVNHGAKTSVAIRQAWDIRTRIGYLKFDFSGIGGDLSGTKLGIDLTGNKRLRTWSVFELADGNDDWGEMSVTYNSAPGFEDTNLGQYIITPELTKVADLTVDGENPGMYWSTAFTPNPGADNLLTLAIVYETDSNDTNPEWYFKSKEATDLPQAPTLRMPNATGGPIPPDTSWLHPYDDDYSVFGLWHMNELVDKDGTDVTPDDDSNSVFPRDHDMIPHEDPIALPPKSPVIDANEFPVPDANDPCEFGASTFFNGYSDLYLEADTANDDFLGALPDNIRWEAWYKFDPCAIAYWESQTVTSWVDFYLFYHGSASAEQARLYIRYNEHTNGAPWWQIIGRVRLDKPLGTFLGEYNVFADVQADNHLNGWHHLAMTYHTGELIVYFDGDEFLSDTTIDPEAVIRTTGRPLRIGPGFWGWIDEARVSVAEKECGHSGYLKGDVNHDCYVDLTDLAEMIESGWLSCTIPYDANCVQDKM